jgi:hypothetical protein
MFIPPRTLYQATSRFNGRTPFLHAEAPGLSAFVQRKSVEMSLDAADTSVCATVASGDFADGNKELASVR